MTKASTYADYKAARDAERKLELDLQKLSAKRGETMRASMAAEEAGDMGRAQELDKQLQALKDEEKSLRAKFFDGE